MWSYASGQRAVSAVLLPLFQHQPLLPRKLDAVRKARREVLSEPGSMVRQILVQRRSAPSFIADAVSPRGGRNACGREGAGCKQVRYVASAHEILVRSSEIRPDGRGYLVGHHAFSRLICEGARAP